VQGERRAVGHGTERAEEQASGDRDLHCTEQIAQRLWNIEAIKIAPDGDGVLRHDELFDTPLEQKHT
jgi:hypothetical protein